MAISAQPGETIRVGVDGLATGLTGTARVRVMQGATTILAATTAGIVEIVAGSGSYEATIIAPGAAGRYRIAFDSGVVSPTTFGTDDLVVVQGVPSTVLLGPDTRLPVGTVVSLYQDNEAAAARKGTPNGAALQTATVGSDSKFTFSGLTATRPYQAYALVAGQNVWVTFTA